MFETPRGWGAVGLVLLSALVLTTCNEEDNPLGPELDRSVDPALVTQGRDIFRFDTFGDEVFWTDTLRMHLVIASSVSPTVAFSVGLKADVEALPAALQADIRAGRVDLNSPATTVGLLKLNA